MIWFLLSTLAFATGSDGVEITTSKGKAGALLVLYPRITPTTEDAAVHELAAAVQQRIYARGTTTGVEVDLRPAPERACPLATGCKAAALSAVLIHQEGGCAVVFTASKPGLSTVELTPWAGRLELAETSTAFRTAPERLVTVHDFAPCSDLEAQLGKADSAVDAAIAAALKE